MCGFLHRKFGKRFYQPGTSPKWKCFESRCRQGQANHQHYFRKHTHHPADSLPPSDEPLLRSIESAYSRNFLPTLVGYSCHNLNARAIPTTRIQTKRVPHPSSKLNCVVHHMLLLLQMVYLEWFCREFRQSDYFWNKSIFCLTIAALSIRTCSKSKNFILRT